MIDEPYVAPLRRDEPDADTSRELVRLGDLWRDAYARLRSATDLPGSMPLEWRASLASTWRRNINLIEQQAGRLVLLERSVMFADECHPPDNFDPVYLEYSPGRSIYVGAGGVVRFYPDEPQLMPNATAEEPAR